MNPNFPVPDAARQAEKEAVNTLQRRTEDGIGYFVCNPAFAVGQQKSKTKKRDIVNKIKNLMFAAIAGTLLSQPSVVRADDHKDAVITWTKHITALFPPGGEVFGTIAGTAAGDLGTGTVNGEAFYPVDVVSGGSLAFEAEYHFVGSKHSFTVHFSAVQAPDGSGVIMGVVTDGWLKGNVVQGHYTAYSCNEVNLTCFDGVFIIKKGSKNNK